MKKKLTVFVLTAAMIGGLFVLPSAAAADGLVAFPGAEGAGKYATGGRGGTVVHVTNLNDSGTGSFRDAVAHTNRIVVFDVGGTVNLKSDVSVSGNITVAGQTAPGGGGITLRGGKIGMAGDNTIIRFVSSRPGENGVSECDAWGGSKGSNSMIDHCSIGWANDEQFGLYSGEHQTVQYSLIGPANCISYHAKGAHGFGIMMGSKNNTWHHNMIAHNISRNFRGKMGGALDYVNNVIYNWGYNTAYGTFGQENYVGNYFKQGPSTRGGNRFIAINSGTSPEKYRFYLTGNKLVKPDGSDYNAQMNTNNWLGVDYGSSGLTQQTFELTSPLKVTDVNGNDASIARGAQSADDAFNTVVAYAGAGISAAKRPRIDAEVMEEARTGGGSLTGGRDFSTLTSSDTELNEAIAKYGIIEMKYDEYYPPYVPKEINDSDNDGMPDEWELARGLDPNNANDARGDYQGTGYTNIEYYINDLTVNAFPAGVVEPSPTLTDLGEEYQNAAEDADSIRLPKSVKTPADITLPTVGAKGSAISWTSSSKVIVIKNNRVTAVNRSSAGSDSVVLTAAVKNGDFTLKRSFTVTVPGMPTKFDFGAGTVQSGYVAVSAATKYTSGGSYGFDNDDASDMTRAPGDIPTGYDELYADQVDCRSTFKAEVPNGKYKIVIHYGSWNTGFGTSYTVEGVPSGNLYSETAAQYVTETEVTDGVLDIGIAKGAQRYGGYINGLEIIAPRTDYSFDFGDGAVQSGCDAVTSGTWFTPMTGYGFTEGSSQEGMTRAPYDIPSGMEDLHNDQIWGETTFKVELPNGKYRVTIHYGSWNTGFGTNYVIEGTSSGNLYSETAAEYTTEVNVTDGMLDLEIRKGSKSYGGYINGMDIESIGEAATPTPTPEPTATPVPTPEAVVTGNSFNGSGQIMKIETTEQEPVTSVEGLTLYIGTRPGGADQTTKIEYATGGREGTAIALVSGKFASVNRGPRFAVNTPDSPYPYYTMTAEFYAKPVDGTAEPLAGELYYNDAPTALTNDKNTVVNGTKLPLIANEWNKITVTITKTEAAATRVIAVNGTQAAEDTAAEFPVFWGSNQTNYSKVLIDDLTVRTEKAETPEETPMPTEKPNRISVAAQPSGEGYSVSAEFEYNTDTEDELMAAVAVYGENGSLISLRFERIMPEPDGAITLDGVSAVRGNEIRAMLWKAEELCPIAEAEGLTVGTE